MSPYVNQMPTASSSMSPTIVAAEWVSPSGAPRGAPLATLLTDLLANRGSCVLDRLIGFLLLLEDERDRLAPSLPDRRHLRDRGHGVATRGARREGEDVLVRRLVPDGKPCRGGRHSVVEGLHGLVGGHELGEERLREELVLTEGTDHPALRADERPRRALHRRDGRDAVVHLRRPQVIERPRAGDEHGRLLFLEEPQHQVVRRVLAEKS